MYSWQALSTGFTNNSLDLVTTLEGYIISLILLKEKPVQRVCQGLTAGKGTPKIWTQLDWFPLLLPITRWRFSFYLDVCHDPPVPGIVICTWGINNLLTK